LCQLFNSQHRPQADVQVKHDTQKQYPIKQLLYSTVTLAAIASQAFFDIIYKNSLCYYLTINTLRILYFNFQYKRLKCCRAFNLDEMRKEYKTGALA
jgi:hypothetical protein